MNALLGGFAQFFVPVHLLAVAALGLLAGQNTTRFPASLLAAFVFGIVVGSIMIAAALREQNAVPVLLTIASLAGVTVVAASPVPLVIQVVVASATGGTLALSSPPQEITIAAAIAAQLGTAFGAITSLMLVIFISMHSKRSWQRIGVRIVGSWIAASAILVLALRLAR